MSRNEFTIDGESYPIIHFATHLKLGRMGYRYLLTELNDDGVVKNVTLSDVVSFRRSNAYGDSTSRFSVTASDCQVVPDSLFTSSNFVVFSVRLQPSLNDGEIIETYTMDGVRQIFVFNASRQLWMPLDSVGTMLDTNTLMKTRLIAEVLFDGLGEPVAEQEFEIKR